MKRILLIVLVAGLALRVLLVATSIGSNDIVFMLMWARLAEQYGVAGAYAHHPLLNHPPLALAIFHLLDLISKAAAVEYTNLLRLLQCLADVATTAVLFAITKREQPEAPLFAPVFFFLSPASIFVSGFHGNTDPTMIALLAGSLAAAARERRPGLWSGALLACAGGIKIVALLALPFYLIHFRRRLVPFLLAFAAASALIFVPAMALGGFAVARNVFGYSGMAANWGIVAVAQRLGWQSLVPVYIDFGKYVILLALLGLAALYFRWSGRSAGQPGGPLQPLAAIIGVVQLVTVVLAPGFGVQYLLWPIPFLPFLLDRRAAILISVTLSLFLFVAYTEAAQGFPWWYADFTTVSAQYVFDLGTGIWVILAIATVAALRGLRARMLFSPAGAHANEKGGGGASRVQRGEDAARHLE